MIVDVDTKYVEEIANHDVYRNPGDLPHWVFSKSVQRKALGIFQYPRSADFIFTRISGERTGSRAANRRKIFSRSKGVGGT